MDDSYYVDDDKNIKSLMDHVYLSAYTVNASYWQQGNIDKRFKTGDQTLWTMIYGDNKYYQTRKFFFNLIRRHINMIAGFQRKNRKSTIAIGISDGDDQLADDYTAALMWSERRDGTQEYLSQAFEGALDTGLAFLHLYPDYTHDPISGDLMVDNVAYNNVLVDPYFRKQDLSDCNFIWRRRWVSKNAAKSILPGRAAEIDKMQPSSTKDGRFPLQAELINLDTNRLSPYDEFYYRAFREATMVLDPHTGEAVEWEDDQEAGEDELERTLAQQPWLVVTKVQKPTVKMALVLNGRVMYHGPNHLKVDSYPFVPCLAYHEPDVQSYSWRIQGVIRNLRDAQFLYNRRKVIELDILESQINSGWVYPIDAVTDPKAFRQTGQGFLIPLKTGHTAGELERITPPDIPASMIELSRSLAEDITKISGVNEELLGAATDDKAGILSMLRQGAGLTTLQTLFDKLDYTQKLLGKLRLEAIRKNFKKGKLKRILGREPDPRFYHIDTNKYDIAVEEGIYSTSQKQMELAQLLHFKELGMAIPDSSILRASSVSGKNKLIEDINASQQQQQQMQEAQMQMEQEKANVDKMTAYAKAKSDMAAANDKQASAADKLVKTAETQANTEYNRVKTDLELVNLMVQLENLDRQGLKDTIEMVERLQSLKQAEKPAQETMQPMGAV